MPSFDTSLPRPLRWLYVDFNSYFASVEQQMNPSFRGRPLAVIPVETESTCAIAASYEAKAFGIRTGTPVHEARRLCPQLICVLARHNHYVEFHHRLIEEIGRHIPVVDVRSIDEMACYLLSNENSVGRATEIALSIKRGIAANIGEYVRCSIGVAPNMYLAKVATDIQKPDGLTFIHSHDLPGKLYGLKLRDLPGIGHHMEERIRRSGIHDVKTLLALDAKQMRRLWGGVWGERMYYYLRGVELPEIETERSSVGHSHVMAPELRPPDKARQVARRLTMKAASRLRRIEYYASGMSLSVRVENGPRLATERTCFRAQDSLTFLRLLDEMWEELSPHMKGQRVKKASIVLHKLTSADALLPDLFPILDAKETTARAKAERMSRALDRLNQRYGRDTVTLGIIPKTSRDFSGTKVAFTRIPDREEFWE